MTGYLCLLHDCVVILYVCMFCRMTAVGVIMGVIFVIALVFVDS